MHPGDKMNRKIKKIFMAALAVVCLFIILSLTVDYLFPIEPPPSFFCVGLNIEKVDREYNITCVSIHNDKGYNLNLSNVEVRLDNKSGVLIHSSLSDLVDNKGSQVVFYDKDSDGRLSVGDLFIVRGVEPDTVFTIALQDGGGSCMETLY